MSRPARANLVAQMRRGFSRRQLGSVVGWVGCDELHLVGCPDYLEADARRDAIAVGPLDECLVALQEDYAAGNVEFPQIHDCILLAGGMPRQRTTHRPHLH